MYDNIAVNNKPSQRFGEGQRPINSTKVISTNTYYVHLKNDIKGSNIIAYIMDQSPYICEEGVAGVDEAGRGPLFGPVVAAAVILPSLDILEAKGPLYKSIKDSKKLAPRKRMQVAEYIKEVAITYGVGVASAKEIDEINILQATYVAMHRSLDQAYSHHAFTEISVDGPNFKAYFNKNYEDGWLRHKCITDGDATYMNIAAASILAKTHHDQLILDMIAEDPELAKYGLANHKGYGTKQHYEALRLYGPSQHHRKSFRLVSKNNSDLKYDNP